MRLQRDIVKMLCQQRAGNLGNVVNIRQFIARNKLKHVPSLRLYMAYHQVLFLMNYPYARNRLREGRYFLRKAQEAIAEIGRNSSEIKQQQLQQMSQHQEGLIQLIFR